MGQGRGGGGDEQSVVIGYGVAVGLIVFLCTFGVPMFIAGGILVAVFPYGSTLTAGIVLLVIAGLFTIVGLVFIILLCVGVIGQSNKTTPAVPTTITVVQSGNQGMYMQQQQQQYATPYPGGGTGWGVTGYQQTQPYGQVVPPPYAPPYSAPPPYTADQYKQPGPPTTAQTGQSGAVPSGQSVDQPNGTTPQPGARN